MKKFVIATAMLFFLAGIATPVQASQVAAKKYLTCADLLKKNPNGVAENKKARNKAVKNGFAKPKVSKSLYKKNSKRLDSNKNGVMCEQKAGTTSSSTAPPAVVKLGIKPPNPDLSWNSATPMYQYEFQIPADAVSQLDEIQVTRIVDKIKDPAPTTSTTSCRDGVCTISGISDAPWGSEVVLSVVTKGVNGMSSKPVTTSAVFPARPKQTNTWTFVANGSRTAVPNSTGGDDWANGNQTRTLELSRRMDKWALLKYSVFANDNNGVASCEILRDGIRVDFKRSTGGSVNCFAGE